MRKPGPFRSLVWLYHTRLFHRRQWAKATKNRRLILRARPFPRRIQPEKGRPGRHPQNPSSVYFKHSLPVLPSAASGHPKIPPGSPSPSQPGSPGRWMRRAGPRYALQWQDPVPFLQWPWNGSYPPGRTPFSVVVLGKFRRFLLVIFLSLFYIMKA